MTDPIADLLTRIRNASRALSPDVKAPYSRMKEEIAKILKKSGYVADVKVEGDTKVNRRLRIRLKYQERVGVIAGLRRISKPGLRSYVNVKEIPRVLGGMGIAILSTSNGVMTGNEARKQNVGGEVLCYVW